MIPKQRETWPISELTTVNWSTHARRNDMTMGWGPSSTPFAFDLNFEVEK